MTTRRDGENTLKPEFAVIWGLLFLTALLGVAGIFLLPRWLSPARVGREALAPNRSAESAVLDLVPAREVLAEACRALWEFRTVHAEEAGADLAERRREAAIRSAAKLYRAFREPLAERAGLCRDQETVFRFDDGGAVIWRIRYALEIAGGSTELIGTTDAALRCELLDDFKARIKQEREGALISTLTDAVARWHFSGEELDLDERGRKVLASIPDHKRR